MPGAMQEMANAPKVIVGADNQEAMQEIRVQARTNGKLGRFAVAILLTRTCNGH